jgi:hypothetical protein
MAIKIPITKCNNNNKGANKTTVHSRQTVNKVMTNTKKVWLEDPIKEWLLQ